MDRHHVLVSSPLPRQQGRGPCRTQQQDHSREHEPLRDQVPIRSLVTEADQGKDEEADPLGQLDHADEEDDDQEDRAPRPHGGHDHVGDREGKVEPHQGNGDEEVELARVPPGEVVSLQAGDYREEVGDGEVEDGESRDHPEEDAVGEGAQEAGESAPRLGRLATLAADVTTHLEGTGDTALFGLGFRRRKEIET